MNKIRAAITAVAAYLPEDRLTNADLEKMVDTNDEWIKSRTGIEERRILKGEGKGVTDMALPAAQELLRKRGISAAELDLIIFATTTPDMVFPASSNILGYKLGAVNAFGFDINAACSGFLFALNTAAKYVESGTHKKVLVVGGDKMSSIVDYTDRRTCIIFGDGAGCVLLEPTLEEGVGIIDSELKSDGSGMVYLNMKAGGSCYPATETTVANREHYVFQDGQPVFKAAVKGMVDTMKTVMTRNNFTIDDLNWLIPHQANRRILESVASMGSIPTEKVVMNIQKYGNTTSGTLPICMWEWESKFKKGDNIILTAFGGGFTWGSLYLKWAY